MSKSVLFKSLFVTCSLSVLGSVIAAHAEDIVISGPQNATVELNGGDTLTITKDGIIEPPSGDEGVVSTGGNNEVLNNGTVRTEGERAYGIRNESSDYSPVTNSGTVRTEGERAYGIYNIFSSNSPVTNSGTVRTEGERAYGIRNESSDYSPVTNSGTVRTEGERAYGIYNIFSSNSPVTNSGTVRTEGERAYGIRNESSDYSPVTNSGTVRTEGERAYGIYNIFSSNSPVTNSGTVRTEGERAYGIRNESSDYSPVTNSGTVRTEGVNAWGIYNENSDNSPVSNSGTVWTEGGYAYGIYNNNSNNSPVTNSGTVHTEGDYAYGIFNSNSDYSPVTNSGTVRTEGTGAYGIYSRDNTNSAVTNRGSVISEQSDAIRMEDDGGVLNLEAPGFIGGRINFYEDTTVNLKTGPSHSVLWDLSSGKMIGDNPASFSGPVPWFYNDTTKQYATYDPTGLAASVNGLGDMTSLLSMVGRNGLGRVNGPSAPSANGFVSSYLPASPASDADRRIEQAFGDPANVTDSDNAYAADLDTADMSYAAPGRFWITGFGGEMTHDGDSMTLEHDITQMGVAAGYTWQQSSGLTLGVMAGYLQSDMDANSRFTPSHDIESQGWFAGLYGEQAMETFTIDFGVNGGMLSHDSSRFVNDNLAPLGVAHAKADYDSWFISPEIGIRTDIDTGNGLIVTPSARVRYAHQSIDGFSESGSNANAKIAGRDIGMIEASAEIAVSKQLSFGTLTGRVGYVSRNSTGDEAVSITMIGINNKVGFGDTDSEAAYVGLSTDIDLSASSKLVLDANAFYSGNMEGYQGMAKLVASF